MAVFIGTDREYHDYIGPRIRNVVQRITQNEKRKCNRTCAHCKKQNIELEAAHIHGNERKKIVENILSKYKKGDYYEIDIGLIESEIIKAHYPIDQNFIFLCRPCHIKYDSEYKDEDIFEERINTSIVNINSLPKSKDNTNDDDTEVLKVQRKLPNWFRNKDQYNSIILYAFLSLYDSNERVSYTELEKKANIKSFKSNFDQMKNFGEKNNGKIFEQNGEYIYLWDKTKELVLNTYKNMKK